MTTRVLCLTAAFLGAVAVSRASITYDSGRKTIAVTGFSQETPGTLQDVFRHSTEQDWGVVAYDAATQTCTVKAHLVIGASDGSSTWFRLGTKERPRETLVIGGLISKEEARAVHKFPILADVPVLGRFFQSVRKDNSERELIMFVTPQLVPKGETAARAPAPGAS